MLRRREIPDFTTLERVISNRQVKIYLDFQQNRPGATVSVPVTWDEVRPGLTARDLTIHNAIARLKETGDLFAGVLGTGIDLRKTSWRLAYRQNGLSELYTFLVVNYLCLQK